MSDTVQELRINARLLYENKEVHATEKIFGLKDAQTEDAPSETLDQTVTKFVTQLEETAKEKGFTISDEEIVKATTSLIICFFNPQQEQNIDIDVTKPEVSADGDKADT